VPDCRGIWGEPARDILAAEAFAVPAPDPALRRIGVLPEHPAGISEPHDILAAEEFAMPAPHRPPGQPGPALTAARTLSRWIWIPGAGLLALWLCRRGH
jgi:hypothetical protein